MAPVRIPEPKTLSKWAIDNFYLSAESSAIEGTWRPVPWQVDIMDAISNDDIRVVDWIKPARVGYTKILMAASGYFLEYLKRSGVIYQPTDGDAKEFSKSEVDPMIRDCPRVRKAFKGDPERRSATNTLELKSFIGALWYIRGGNSGRAYRRLTVDWVMFDEVEAFEHDVDSEGDPISLGDKRISNSAFPKSIRGSTPKLKAASLIYKEIQLARHLFRYWIHCPGCDVPSVMVFAQLRWDQGKPETVRYQCEHCDRHWHYHELGELLVGGFWGTEDGYRIREGALLDPSDKVIEWPRHIAFQIWAAYSPFFTWRELVEEWLEATIESKAGDIRKLKTFTNTRLAEPWEDAGEQPQHDQLYLRRENYTRPPPGVLLVVCTVDVQDNRLELEFIGVGRGEETWGLEYRVLYGDPTFTDVWRELEVQSLRTFKTEDDRVLPVAGIMVDAGYLPDHVYAHERRTRHPRCFVTKGVGGQDKPIASAPQQRKSGRKKDGVDLFLHGADVCKSIVYKRLERDDPGPGYCHFPDSYDQEYFRGLTAEKRIRRMRKGFEVIEWIKDRPRNEPLDLRAMAVALVAILNPAYDALDPSNAPIDAAEQPAAPYVPQSHKRSGRRPGRRDRERWRR